MVAPAYIDDSYVDHVLSANLDSTYAFEGPEKLLEVWFWPSQSRLPPSVSAEGLRAIPLEKWVNILDLVSCKILSMKSSPGVDAYLLSELSLFVFPHKMILKTCGTTTTLAAMDELFDIARQHCGIDGNPAKLFSKEVFKVFYSRRSFMFPDRQKHVHTSWKQEVELLNQHFVSGKLYVVGDFTLDDHWYLYMGGAGCSSISRPGSKSCFTDQTFEILMTKLDPSKAKQFVTSRKPGPDSMVESDTEDHDLGHDDGMDTMHSTGMSSLFRPSSSRTFNAHQMPSPLLSDNMELSDDEANDNGVSTPKETADDNSTGHRSPIEFIHDAFAFTPCGYSSNSISTNSGGYYYTLHITPESGWSYASFETNYPFSATSSVGIVDVMKRVLNIFKPGRFSVTLINEADPDLKSVLGVAHHDSLAELASSEAVLAKLGYKKHERVIYDLKSEYNLLYMNFEKQ